MHHHHHSHDCDHHHAPKDFNRAFMAGIALNTAFIAAEIVYGLKANSLALLADAGHNAGDVLSLAIAWGAAALSKREPCERFTYGLRGSSIIASLINAVLLLIVVGGIGWEAVKRFAHPEVPAETTVMAVAAIGILINGVTALFFMRGRDDINIRGAYLHMVADAAISLGVVISGAVMLWTGWAWVDPLTSIAISLIIVAGTWALLRESVALALQGVPAGIDLAAVRSTLQKLPGVREVHDLHIWAMSTTEVAATVHLIMPGGHPGDAFLRDLAHRLAHDFRIIHATVQIEVGDTPAACDLAPDHIV